MADVHAQMKDAAAHNHELLGALAATDYAPPALEQHRLHIRDLQRELAEADSNLKKLEQTRRSELKDHEKYRDSVMRRFAYKVARKEARFTEKAGKEEREYFAALETEHRAHERRRWLAGSLDEAQGQRQKLEETSQEHKSAQKQLDELYQRIFGGPTPAFPEEDAAEGKVQQSQSAFDAAVAQTQMAKEVISLLEQAVACMAQAHRSMDDALSASRMDMFGAGAFADMMERSALGDAQNLTGKVYNLVGRACHLDPQNVRQLPRATIASGSLMSDVFFDNIFTDMAFHEKIQQSTTELNEVSRQLDLQIHGARQRHKDRKDAQAQRGKELQLSREQLQKSREAAFESMGKQ